MSGAYQAVQWNRQKRWYDFALAGVTGGYLLAFGAVTLILFPQVTAEVLLMRAFGTAAFLLLHLILLTGPLSRLEPRLLPCLYNRRHAGVTCFLLALIHAALVVTTYHAGGDVNPWLSILAAGRFDGTAGSLPFQVFGLMALVILFLLAATSHDFWLANLTAPVWKTLHMLVYAAYALLVLHVTFGVLQSETSPVLTLATGLGLILVLGTHLAAARRERRLDEAAPGAMVDGWVDVCAVADLLEHRARAACLAGERVAIFRFEGKIAAVSSVCQHQNGPLAEGRIVAGCITCPWHGYQYRPETGASPPPFTEKISTFPVRVRAGRVLVNPRPNLPGTFAEPAVIPS